MATKGNRGRIIEESIRLFNHQGVSDVSTNHICQSLDISPGNLYFHFRNKEEIVRELFDKMTAEIYSLWDSGLDSRQAPLDFIEGTLEVFWRYRFFHREMYHLRRQDAALAKAWHKHLQQTRKIMKVAYARWAKAGWVSRRLDPVAMQTLSDLTLLTASSFFQFYESAEKPATRVPLTFAKQYLARFLSPYFTESYRGKLSG